jgi:phosphoglycerol transferase MdoB-like AlkP superfamily enzyme
LGQPAALALSLLGSVAITVVMFGMQPTSILVVWENIKLSGFMTFVYNWLPVALVVLALQFALNSAVAACGAAGLVVCVLSFVNRNMINMRQDPFKPNDILLGGEFLAVAKSVDSRTFIELALLLLGFAAAFAAGFLLLRNKSAHPVYRVLGAAACAGALLLVNKQALSSERLYSRLPMSGNVYNQTDNFQSKGFLYSFIYTLNNSKLSKPANYDRDYALISSISEKFAPPDYSGARKPNIVLVLSEAFSDMLDSPLIDYSGYEDPLKNFKSLAEESIYGHIVVPNVGGGTSDTEFDIFTAMNSRHFRGAPYAYSLIAKDTPALPSILGGIGYKSLAIHPGFGWFYNRQNVYPHMGFPGLMDISEFDETDTKGMYVTERQTIEKIISEYESHVDEDPETPFFEFCVTIQNHGPYLDKYGDSSLNFKTEAELSPNNMNAMFNYIYGLLDCDRELKILADFLDARKEPVILIYYGDHLPSFDMQIYNTFLPMTGDPAKDAARLHKTPFIIWQNSASKREGSVDREFKAMGAPEDLVISSSYLGVFASRLLGFAEADPFFKEVSELSQDYPVVLESQYITPSGVLETFDENEDSPLSFYKSWEYFRITRGAGD